MFEIFEWGRLAAHALWIGGASLLLALWSYQSWTQTLLAPRAVPPRWLEYGYLVGLGLVAGGWLGLSDQWWERAGWLLIILLALGRGYRVAR